MACTSPKKAWAYGITKNGKTKHVFKRPQGHYDDPILLPCTKCVSCKLSASREWATRITHEAQTSLISCFITLTYADEHLPAKRSVNLETIQVFMKALRHQISPTKVKFFACGEYGSEKGHRPHYHLIILGYDFTDKTYWKRSSAGEIVYRSNNLEKLWKKGYSTLGDVTYTTAAYVARYTLKKSRDKKTYEHVDTNTGEINQCSPEILTMSGGIGKTWWEKYKGDTQKDYLNVNFQKNKVPRYYDKKMEEHDPNLLAQIKEERAAKAKKIHAKETKGTLRQKDTVKKAQLKFLKRGFENA